MTKPVTLFEMSARDGLQNEKAIIATADKIHLINQLSLCGFKKIEAASFVSPKWVPQMADAADVMAGINRRDGIVYTALTPNMRGFTDAQRAQADEVAIFASASESFSRKNINCSIAESLERFKPVLTAAKQANIPVRAYISCVANCPYEGAIKPPAVAQVAKQLLTMGCYEISLGETLGTGIQEQIAAMLDEVLLHVPAQQLAGHFHDTESRALGNIAVALDKGLRTFDASAGGLGGCPYAPGAKGNVATEAVVAYLHQQGFSTGINIGKLQQTAHFAQNLKKSRQSQQ